MSKKVVVVRCAHVFCGYHSDSDYWGNAIFEDSPLDVRYVSKKKAKRVLADMASKAGFTILDCGTVAVAKPEDPRYPDEHQHMEIMSPAEFLFKFGVLRDYQAEAYLGAISDKDRLRYEAEISDIVDNYDPY